MPYGRIAFLIKPQQEISMGSKNSSRWNNHTAKLTVEDCFRLSASDLAQARIIPPESTSGKLQWTDHYSRLCLSLSYNFISVIMSQRGQKFYSLSIYSPFSQSITVQPFQPTVGAPDGFSDARPTKQIVCATNGSNRSI